MDIISNSKWLQLALTAILEGLLNKYLFCGKEISDSMLRIICLF